MRRSIQHPATSAAAPATSAAAPATSAEAPAPAPAGGGFGRWHSPIPYIFSGLALMLAVIVVALTLLACSYMKSSDQSSNEKSEKTVHAFQPEMEPRVVVIMAGETNPTHLAKPLAAIRFSEEV